MIYLPGNRLMKEYFPFKSDSVLYTFSDSECIKRTAAEEIISLDYLSTISPVIEPGLLSANKIELRNNIEINNIFFNLTTNI